MRVEPINPDELLQVQEICTRLELRDNDETRSKAEAKRPAGKSEKGKRRKSKAPRGSEELPCCVTLDVQQWKKLMIRMPGCGPLAVIARQTVANAIAGGKTGPVALWQSRDVLCALSNELLKQGVALDVGREIVIQLSKGVNRTQ